jgi:tripartite-type tricarboxylate transporter receptor subunit TctC
MVRSLNLLVGAAIAVVMIANVARAQTSLTSPVRFIVPCAVGTPADLVARIIANGMSENAGQKVHVENIPNLAGMTVTDMADNMLADGNTILFNLGDCGAE